MAAPVLVAVALATSACTGAPWASEPTPTPHSSNSPESATPSGSRTTATDPGTRTATTRPTPTRTGAARDLDRAVAQVAAAHPQADIALAWAPVGAHARVEVVGDPVPLVAWSTIKVPLALAVTRSSVGADATGDVEAAITRSDNDAALALWERLGSGEPAASAVETQLGRGEDRTTQVPAEVTVPGFSPFGQSVWRVEDQTRFTADLPCLAGSGAVTEPMGRVVDGQRWGLGQVAGARYKGGWGQTPEGYVVRQLGVVPGAKGDTAVTLQVRAGNHEEGTAIADELGAAVGEQAPRLPGGTCG